MAAGSQRYRLRPALAGALYGVLIVVLVGLAWRAVASIAEQKAVVHAAEGMLAQLEGRAVPSGAQGRPGFGVAPAGSPFLDGQTVTIAGAALLQRITGAISKAGGSVQSSQVELPRADAEDGWIGLVVSCELEQAQLQPLLYDIEAGMPFLFVDQLVVQAPMASVEERRMRVLLGVSGKWEGRR